MSLDFTFDNGATVIGAVSLPYQGSGTFSVDWGDGTTDTSLTHTYSAKTATAKVQLTGGTITGFGAQNWSGYQLLTSVANNTQDDNWGWGTGAITLEYAFYNASKLTSVPSTIPVGTSSMINMFRGASAFNGDISGWDTSNVTNMGVMFYRASAFNNGGQALTWNTSNVNNMVFMFRSASVFNQDISSWDTSNVRNMRFMFSDAQAFNQNIRGWNTRSVGEYYNMFFGATAMISTYTGKPGFGTTPTSAFFNFKYQKTGPVILSRNNLTGVKAGRMGCHHVTTSLRGLSSNNMKRQQPLTLKLVMSRRMVV